MYRAYGDVTTDWPNIAATTMLKREPSMNLKGKWEYEDGLMLNGIYQIYQTTHDQRYLDYVKSNIDQFVNDKGEIKSYQADEFNLDYINNGKAVLDLYEETH